jgi:hypothetical protein
MDINLEHDELVMGNLNIPYIDIKNELTLYKPIGMIYKVMPNRMAPYQTACFLVEFNGKDISIWFDLTFDQAKQLLTNMENPHSNTSSTNIRNTPNPKTLSLTLAPIGEKIKNEHPS